VEVGNLQIIDKFALFLKPGASIPMARKGRIPPIFRLEGTPVTMFPQLIIDFYFQITLKPAYEHLEYQKV
jgi:hypothetical protein